MAHTDGFDIVRLDETALDGALALSEEAGWNQAADDWRIFFRSGVVYGLREGDAIVATGAILPYAGFGWISMVLTTRAARGRGIGTAILKQATADLAELGCVPVLDATPAGERIYRPLGFLPVAPLWRWRGTSPGSGDVAAGIAQAGESDRDWIIARDAKAFGAPRADLVASLIERAPALALVMPAANGFVLARPGRAATSIGPVVADDEASAVALLEAALAIIDGPVLIDVPEGRTGIEALLTRHGFTKERPYLRMAHGRAEPFGSPDTLFAIAGPELG
ncbi:GNAT family N-acetyltransferase [Phreatobacter aquaticus]|uniref:GNAT family N-acetyltransferase n=1 Tax=Phreatobacter aquaticus TaxID=2570229 RepID=A0A4D7QIQ7_9HYPH|nr:GNAT family N-acetyltransferase [Phreatobacter aquaticus]QCK85693.1 GNAT family N-acetyltransferase [Phreatobacter aquaticus]